MILSEFIIFPLLIAYYTFIFMPAYVRMIIEKQSSINR